MFDAHSQWNQLSLNIFQLNDIEEISLELEFKIVIDACVAVGDAVPGGEDIVMNQMKVFLLFVKI